MRPLLQIAKLLEQAKAAKTAEQTQAALVAVIQHLYDAEYHRERKGTHQ